MMRKICPVCDQIMTTRHYCRNCRSWIKEPYTREIGYYLNERHPAKEADCTYHENQTSHTGGTAKKTGMNRSGNPVREFSPERQSYPERQPYPERQNRSAGQRTAGRAPQGGFRMKQLGCLLGILLLIQLWFAGVRAVRYTAELVTPLLRQLEGREYDVDLGAYTADEDDSGCWEVDEAEVKAKGTSCSSQVHFPVKGPELVEPLIGILELHGYEVAGTNRYSYNEEYDDGGSWYCSWVTVYVADDEEYRYAEIDYDTADERLHRVDLLLGNEAEAAQVAAELLELLGKEAAQSDAEACADIVRTEFPALLERRESYALEYGVFCVDICSWTEDQYEIQIYPKEETE